MPTLWFPHEQAHDRTQQLERKDATERVQNKGNHC
ncbi:unnamed protein product, partial [Cuscuta campestris]